MGTSITFLTLWLEGKTCTALTEFTMTANVGESRNTHASAMFTSEILHSGFFREVLSNEEKRNVLFTDVNKDLPTEVEQAGGEQAFLSQNLHLFPVRVTGLRVQNAYKYEEVEKAQAYVNAKVEQYNQHVQELMDQKQSILNDSKEYIGEIEEVKSKIDTAVNKAGGKKVVDAINYVFGKKSGDHYQKVILAYMQKKQCTADEALDEVINEVKKFRDETKQEFEKINISKGNSSVAALFKDLSEGEEELFRGYIESVTVTKADDGISYKLSGTLKSGTILLDQQARSRSFQWEGMTYKAVIEEVVNNIKTDLQKKEEDVFLRAMYDKAKVNVTFDTAKAEASYKDPDLLEQAIKAPLIQYQETDWNFIRRIASRLRLGIVADVTSWDPKFTVGIQNPQGADSGEVLKDIQIIPNVYVSGFDQAYYEMGGRAAGYIKKNFFHISLLSLTNYSLGRRIDQVPTTVSRNTGITGFWICGKNVVYTKIQNQLHFTYLMAMPAYVTQKRIPFGVSNKEKTILGEVLERKDQRIKILLQIDNDDKTARKEPPIDKAAYQEKAFWYKWAPETGNTMYSMPTVGTQVALYFPDDDEQNAFAIHCVRQEERQDCAGLQTYTNRWFTSEFQQKMFLHPDSMGFISTGNPLHIIQSDSGGIEIVSDGDINITASGSIGINAPSVTLAGKSMNVGS